MTIATGNAIPPNESPVFRNEGQRQMALALESTSLSVVAKRIGISRSAVHSWAAGDRIPAELQRRKLSALYEIPEEAWERLPAGSIPQSSDDDEDEDDPALDADEPINALAACAEQISYIRTQLKKPTISAKERSQAHGDYQRAIKMLANLERERAMSEDRTIREHPKWRRLINAIMAALVKHPAAAREVEAVLSKMLADERANRV